MNAPTACPFLKEVVMIYCDACPSRKLLPRDQVVTLGPCCTADFADCPFYRELARMGSDRLTTAPSGSAGDESEARP